MEPDTAAPQSVGRVPTACTSCSTTIRECQHKRTFRGFYCCPDCEHHDVTSAASEPMAGRDHDIDGFAWPDPEPTSAAHYRPRCRYCGDTLHFYVKGWLHDSNNMATCLLESERQRKWIGATPEDITPLAERALSDAE